jgi:excinuclease ABC subunit C
LLVIDGGPVQAHAAADVLQQLGVEGVHVVGLAKRLEEVWPAGSPDPVILARGSEALYLLQRVRDEAHRFALSHQKRRRTKTLASEALDGIPGLGPARRSALLRHFGSVKRLRQATVDDLEAVDGVGPALAHAIHAALSGDSPSATSGGVVLDTATGEIMDS